MNKKTKWIMVLWLVSVVIMATDNIAQAFVGLCGFTLSSWLLRQQTGGKQSASKQKSIQINK
jgi:hypothetical protein